MQCEGTPNYYWLANVANISASDLLKQDEVVPRDLSKFVPLLPLMRPIGDALSPLTSNSAISKNSTSDAAVSVA